MLWGWLLLLLLLLPRLRFLLAGMYVHWLRLLVFLVVVVLVVRILRVLTFAVMAEVVTKERLRLVTVVLGWFGR